MLLLAVLTPALLPLAALFLLVEKWHHGIGSRKTQRVFKADRDAAARSSGGNGNLAKRFLIFDRLSCVKTER